MYLAVVISIVLKTTGAIGQEQKTEEVVPAKNPDAPWNSDGMRCCQDMEKMAEKMKAMGAPDASQKAETIYEIETSSENNTHKH